MQRLQHPYINIEWQQYHMAKVNLSKAARLVGKNRTTIWRHINNGKILCEKNSDGLPFIDTTELIKVYGKLKENATPQANKTSHAERLYYDELLKTITKLQQEQNEIKILLNNLANKLEDPPQIILPQKQQASNNPEDDPLWPKEITSAFDITQRNEIRNKYKQE